jgi:hypothetical protein
MRWTGKRNKENRAVEVQLEIEVYMLEAGHLVICGSW